MSNLDDFDKEANGAADDGVDQGFNRMANRIFIEDALGAVQTELEALRNGEPVEPVSLEIEQEVAFAEARYEDATQFCAMRTTILGGAALGWQPYFAGEAGHKDDCPCCRSLARVAFRSAAQNPEFYAGFPETIHQDLESRPKWWQEAVKDFDAKPDPYDLGPRQQ